ncbi:MAG: DUF6503 family protein [Acidobacteriota bacterium]
MLSRVRSAVRPFLVICLLIALLAPAASWATGHSEGAARASGLADRLMEALGGADAWAAARHVQFNFFGFRNHDWDRHTGDHRLEGFTREGQHYVVLHNIESREGGAWVDGEAQSGEELAEWLERAYGAWVNDVYWLAMPYKLKDPGVTLAYDGTETIDGVDYEKVKLSFEQVGLTPGDVYWAYLHPETGLMAYWAYFLQSWEADREPTRWAWTDWNEYAGVQLSTTRVGADGSARSLGPIAVSTEIADPAVFTDPAARMERPKTDG